jgi:segregation and condensation protein B
VKNEETVFPIIEAMLFAMGQPLECEKITEVLELSGENGSYILEKFADTVNKSGRGVKIVKINDSIQMVTRSEYHKYVAKLMETKSQKTLSQASLETLSIIAYNQPVTKSMIESVRGVDSQNSVMKLLERDLIEQRGRLDAPGRPMLYGTTEEFLRIFGLENLSELPELELSVLSGIQPDNNLTFDDIVAPKELSSLPGQDEKLIKPEENP